MSNEWVIFYFSFNLLIEVVNILIILSLLITYYLLLITHYSLLILSMCCKDFLNWYHLIWEWASCAKLGVGMV